MPSIGIRIEDKNEWERRVPLTPKHVRKITEQGIRVVVQPSAIRAFTDEEYKNAGSQVQEDIWTGVDVIFGVKEMPVETLQPSKTYMYFSHVIKGQRYNMPMLQHLLDSGSTLLDYEKIVDEKKRRLIFFGNYAGFAGMIDSLWAYGQRLKWEGADTPLSNIKPAHGYPSLEEAKTAITAVGKELVASNLNSKGEPFVVGFLGYGNVSRGAQEILDCLPVEEVQPEALEALFRAETDLSKVYKVVFYEKHLVRPKDPTRAFALQDYYDHPQSYESQFENYLPFLTIAMNAVYWQEIYPRFITKAWVEERFRTGQARLKVIGDISCDIGGAVEVTLKCTGSGDPVFVYDVDKKDAVMGVEGNGPVVLAVDNLPCELPKESSTFFGDRLEPFVSALANADYTVSFDELALPDELKRAVIVYQGKLTPDYHYLEKFLT